MIDVKDLRFRYGERGFALHVPEFRLEAGRTAVCIGPSGCGKTTFLHLLAGILLPESGRVAVEGTEPALCSDAARRRFRIARIGLVFQEFALLDHLSVRENILLPYLVNPALRLDDAAEARARDLAVHAGVAGQLERRPRRLSHGERQRVAICRALVAEPALLLADEPTGNLDPDATGTVLDLLLAEVERRSAGLVMVTHDHSLLGRFDRVVDFAEFAS